MDKDLKENLKLQIEVCLKKYPESSTSKIRNFLELGKKIKGYKKINKCTLKSFIEYQKKKI